jgi:hypothetical protein
MALWEKCSAEEEEKVNFFGTSSTMLRLWLGEALNS